MTVRREYGSGGLTQRKSDGVWVGTIEAGWYPNGGRRRLTVSSKDKAEAKRKLRDKRLAFEAGSGGDVSDRATVKSWAEEWLPITERDLSPSAYATNQSAVNRWIIPTIGHKRLDRLTPADVRAVGNAQRDAGRKGSTQARTHSVLMTLLKAAIVEGHAVPQRLLVMKPPVKAVSDRTDMAVSEAVAVLEKASELDHGSRYVAAFLQATRQAETLGMEWDRVDFDRGLMEVSWQLKPLPYRKPYDRTSGFRVPDGYEHRQLVGALHLVRPKSKAGWRLIPMVPWMRTALESWRDAAPESPHGLVWPNADGSPRYYKDDDAEWYALQAAAGVHHPTRLSRDGKPAPYTIHETRHTAATLLMEAGVEPAVIIRIVGHSSFLSTHSYLHVHTGPALDGLNRVAERLQLG